MNPMILDALLSGLAAIAECQADIAGMTAENMVRESLGHSMAYDQAAFVKVAEEMNGRVHHAIERIRNFS